jgi:hypothetical protein
MTNFERINSEKFKQLSRQDLNEIRGGWKLFGKEKSDLLIDPLGRSGRIVKTYLLGVVINTSFYETDQLDN